MVTTVGEGQGEGEGEGGGGREKVECEGGTNLHSSKNVG